MKAPKAILSSVVFGAFFFASSLSASAAMVPADLLKYSLVAADSVVDAFETAGEVLVGTVSGLLIDSKKFKAGGGSFRGGGTNRYPTRYDIPADSLIQNPYYEYFEAPIQEYQNAPTPVVQTNGYIAQYVYPSQLGLLPSSITGTLADSLSSVSLVYPFADQYYYFGTSWPFSINAITVENLAALSFYDIPMAGQYTLLYPDNWRGGMYGSIVRASSSVRFRGENGGGMWRLYSANGDAISKASTNYGFSANVGQKLAVLRTFSNSTSSYNAAEFVSLECLAQPVILGLLPSMPQYRPSQIPTFNGFDVDFDANLNVDLFTPVVINVDTPDIAFDFSVNIDNSTYPVIRR